MLRISVIINTYNRAASLRRTLQALHQLDYPAFEVVVVNGPSADDTETVLAEFADWIKIGRCANANLSESRNIGVALAAGEIVAFIDDDAYPDPAWLDRLAEAYADEEVAAAGGPVYDYTGARLQTKYNIVSRFGDITVSMDSNPTDHLNYPSSHNILSLIGTNSSFRRDRLIAIGGFDEEYEYFLEETDVCVRLVDLGYVIRAMDDGYVYHKFLASHLRTEARVLRNMYPIIKNRCYFALKYGLDLSSHLTLWHNLVAFIESERVKYRNAMEFGILTQEDYERFYKDVDLAIDHALQRHYSGTALVRDIGWFEQRKQPFKSFPVLRTPADKLHIAFYSQEYPPGAVNGIGRVVHGLALGLAARGHIVHVLTRGEDHDRVDLEEGVWVHRMIVRPHALPESPLVPQHISDYSRSLTDELQRIHAHRPVDLVQFPNWDSEGLAALLEGEIPSVVGLYTSIQTVVHSSAGLIGNDAQSRQMIEALTDSERFVYLNAAGLLACGPGIVTEIEHRFGITLPVARLGFVAHGLSDLAAGGVPAPARSNLTVLFVGRLEPRKGIDTLLACVPPLCEAFPDVRFAIVGDDTIALPDGETFRAAFEHTPAGRRWRDRVRFYGKIDDAELRDRYAACDIFVAPSRFESFGLILLEAMMFCKPVVACDVGGMREIVVHGENGFLVPPADPAALSNALTELLRNPELRCRFGKRSRLIYEERFTRDRMVDEAEAYYRKLLATPGEAAAARDRGEPVHPVGPR